MICCNLNSKLRQPQQSVEEAEIGEIYIAPAGIFCLVYVLLSFLSFVDTRALDLLFSYRCTCLNNCCLGKQLIASLSEFWSFKIGGVRQANAYCHFFRFERYCFEVVYLHFVISLLNHMILCIIMLLLLWRCHVAWSFSHAVCGMPQLCYLYSSSTIVSFFDKQI